MHQYNTEVIDVTSIYCYFVLFWTFVVSKKEAHLRNYSTTVTLTKSKHGHRSLFHEQHRFQLFRWQISFQIFVLFLTFVIQPSLSVNSIMACRDIRCGSWKNEIARCRTWYGEQLQAENTLFIMKTKLSGQIITSNNRRSNSEKLSHW
jgi:hypothetical protein